MVEAMEHKIMVKAIDHKIMEEPIDKKNQGQCKAWCIPSPKNLTFDLENQ
jgi:hypothetical protein